MYFLPLHHFLRQQRQSTKHIVEATNTIEEATLFLSYIKKHKARPFPYNVNAFNHRAILG